MSKEGSIHPMTEGRLDDRQKKRIRSLVIVPGHVGEELGDADFLRQFPVSAEESRLLGFRLIEAGLAERDAERIELGFTVRGRFGDAETRIPVLERLATEDALRSKVIHALGNIGTMEACSRLGDLAQRFDDPELIAKIGRQLRRLAERSPSEEIRVRAREALSRLPPDPDDEDDE